MVLRVTPWRDQAEWNFVKECLYSHGASAAQDHARGLARIDAWSVRGRVPHAVVSTAMLTSVIIRDQTSVLSVLEARMLLAMALTRFVNGLLDPAQQAVFAISMSALARSLDLPEAFVEIRHSATHDSLPSLPVLRGAIRRALDWLWHNYWTVQAQAYITQGIEGRSNVELTAKIAAMLRTWRRLRKDQPDRPLKTGDPDSITKDSLALLKELKSISPSHKTMDALSRALLAPKILCSNSSRSTELWTPLLMNLLQHFSTLRNCITLNAIDIFTLQYTHPVLAIGVAASPQGTVKLDEIQCNRLSRWILWLLSESIIIGSEDRKIVMKALSLGKDPWTLSIMETLSKEKGWEALTRLIEIRHGIISTMPDAEGSKRDEKEHSLLMATTYHTPIHPYSSWVLVDNTATHPIGFCIQ